MLGLHTSIDRVVFDRLCKLLVGDGIELGTRYRKVAVTEDTELACDGRGSVAVVAGYHYRANARLAAFLYRVNDFGANGVDHSYKAEEGKVGFHDLGRIIGGSGVISAAGSGKNAQCAVGQALVCLGKLDTHIIRHRNDLTARKDVRASAYNDVGSAGRMLNISVASVVDGRHHLAARVKGYLAHAGSVLFKLVFGKTYLCRIIDNGSLRRVALGNCFALVKHRVGAERKGFGKHFFVVTVVIDNGHFVLREGTGLIGADDLCTSERFNRRQLAYDRVAARHIGNAYRKHDGNDRGKSLGYRRNGKADSHHEGVEYRLAREVGVHADKVDGKYHRADAEHEEAQDLAELIELELERCLLILCLRERVGYLAHLGLHTSGNDHGFAASVNSRRAHIDHVLAVAERNFTVIGGVYCGCGLEHGNGFASQRRFLTLEAGALDQTAVGGDGISRFKHYDIAGDQLVAVQGDLLSVADDL